MKEEHKGELNIIASSLIWSIFPVISILSLQSIPPILTLALSTFFAGLFFGILLFIKEGKVVFIPKESTKEVVLTSLLNGGLFYLLIFLGLQFATAGNASLVGMMEIFFSFLFLRIWGKEKQTNNHIFGATLMVIGAVFVVFQGNFAVNVGDMLILLAYVVPPFGNYFAQTARKQVTSTQLMFTRSFLSGILLFLLSLGIERFWDGPAIFSVLGHLMFLGVVLFGFSKVLWIEGIHRISISKAVSFIPITPIFTMIFAFFLLGEVPNYWQLLGVFPIFLGIVFLTDFRMFRNSSTIR